MKVVGSERTRSYVAALTLTCSPHRPGCPHSQKNSNAPGMPILIDHTALDATALTATDIRAIGEFVATIGKRIGASSIAVVVPDRLTFGFVRMGELIANQPQLNLKTFYSLGEAVAWLPNHRAAAEG